MKNDTLAAPALSRSVGSEPTTTLRSVAVIVNADDFGMNARETEATCEGLAGNRINSASMFANGAALQQALRCTRLLRGRSFGVHLNLTYGVPVIGGAGG